MQGNYKIINGNSYEELKKFPDNYFDSVVTDPPYGLGKEPNATDMLKAWVETGYMEVKGSGFMGKEWDAFVPQPLFWKEVFRVLKHGGHVVAFYGTRTYDWGVMAMRLAGFEIRDSLQWVYGSGFPKSHNISKSIDKMEGFEIENKSDFTDFSKTTDTTKHIQRFKKCLECDKLLFGQDPCKCDWRNHKGISENGKKWNGWGSALKPAVEPIVLARKPLEKGLSIAENVLKWGVGAINIDGCRVGSDLIKGQKAGQGFNNVKGFGVNTKLGNKEAKEYISNDVNGRFPANLLMSHHPDCEFKGMKKVGSGKEGGYNYEGNVYEVDGFINKNSPNANSNYGIESAEDWKCHEDCPIKIMDEQSGMLKSGKMTPNHVITTDGSPNGIYGKFNVNHPLAETYGDSGGASRFFYVAKASKSERNFGLQTLEEKQSIGGGGTYNVEAGAKYGSIKAKAQNFHPTVKPIKLMQYLARLITPPNGRILDPFNGSGTTGVASVLEGFEYVGIELDKEFCNISEARISAWDEIDEYEQYKKIIENQEEDKEKENYGKQMGLFD